MTPGRSLSDLKATPRDRGDGSGRSRVPGCVGGPVPKRVCGTRWTAVPALALMAASLGGCVGGAMTLYEENDVFSVRGRQDRYYTQGARVSRVFPAKEAPEAAQDICAALPQGEPEAERAIGLVFGQQIYTPRDISIEGPQKNDRPYAGWLYGGLVVADQEIASPDRSDDSQRTLEIDVGVVGPASLARLAQESFHRATGATAPRGWDHQIHNEPGIDVSYERRLRLVYADLPLSTGFDLLPMYGATLGNVDTHAGAGATVRFGLNLPRDFGVNTISTTSMETGSSAQDAVPSIYLFGSGEGRGVARNIFLDGNTFRDSPVTVEKDHLVGEFRAGIALQYKALRLTYTWITRSPEFHGQPGWTRYGSLSLGLFLDF
ncbi:MAG: hypothetical protein HMLKMBBP_03869 [Planctomycetes bacterium]|nr:hypothetical protein [Planctomycetota bacterium]